MRARRSLGTPASCLPILTAAMLAPFARAGAQTGALVVGVTAEGEAGVMSNPRFQAGADSADVLARARVGASLTRRSALGAFTAAADGELQRFRATPDLSRSTYGASAGTAERLTPRLEVRGGAGVRTTLSRDVVTGAGLATTGAGAPSTSAAVGALPLLPLTLSHAYTADAAAAYRTSPRTTVTADVGVDRIRYDASALASGTSVRAQVSTVRQLTDADGVSLTLDGRGTQTQGEVLTAASTTFGWDGRLRGAVRLRLRAGAGAFSDARRTTTFSPVGSAELGAPLLGGTWSVRYLRDVSPLLGVGQVVASDQAEASYSRVAPGGLLMRAGVSQAWVRTPAAPGPRTLTNASFADVRRPLAAGFWVGAGAARRSRTQDPTVRSQNLALTAGYAGAW
ncbi:hypothetical protein tb265_43970 [Gemmatimonadetes bacterium T265]|nr:hypothetical protein tb265_43970 [Gemmatimonadetes bacterium T265]